MSCGCGNPDDKRSDNRNITLHDLDQAAQAAGISVEQVAQNIATSWQQIGKSPAASGEWGKQTPWQETPAERPGEPGAPLSEESGTTWGQDQKMGQGSQYQPQGQQQNPEP
ncbi:MAG: hypothetical protein ACJ788_09990 [Ktedonobacteraceae bacterium]